MAFLFEYIMNLINNFFIMKYTLLFLTIIFGLLKVEKINLNNNSTLLTLKDKELNLTPITALMILKNMSEYELKNITSLKLHGYKDMDNIDEILNIIVKCTELKKLDLRRCKTYDKLKYILPYLKNLQEINLQYNKITIGVLRSLTELKNIKRIHLNRAGSCDNDVWPLGNVNNSTRKYKKIISGLRNKNVEVKDGIFIKISLEN